MKRTRLHIYLTIVPLVFLTWTASGRASDPDEGRSARLFGTTKWRPASEVPNEPQVAPGMVIWEVTRHPDGSQTPLQKLAAEDLIERSYRAAEKNGWFDFEVAIREGYTLVFEDDVHYGKQEYVFDDVIFDPERPEFLMYYPNGWKKSLAGFMFFVRNPMEQGPQIGGPETIWHYHMFSRPRCFLKELLLFAQPDESGACRQGVPSYRSPEMIHVWLVDNPAGPFSTNMALDRKLLPDLLERRLEERGF